MMGLCTGVFSQDNKFHVDSLSGDTITINAGSAHGVEEGFTGRTFKITQSGGQDIHLPTGFFEIVSVSERSSQARITRQSETDPVEENQIIEFDQELVPPPREGTLRVSTNPTGAAVYIDGSRIGEAPVKVNLASGNHTIGVQRTGYQDISENIRINSNQNVTRSYSLRRIGYELRIDSNPSDAEVFINQRSMGRSPITESLNRGLYRIRIEKDGYAVLEDEINLSSDMNKEYTLEEMGYGVLRIKFHPYANVNIQNISTGEITSHGEVPPVKEIRLLAGEYKVIFYSDRLGKEKEINVEVIKDETVEIMEEF